MEQSAFFYYLDYQQGVKNWVESNKWVFWQHHQFMVNHCGHSVHALAVYSPPWQLHLSSFLKFPTFIPSSLLWWSCLIFYQENRSCQKRVFSFFHDRFYTPSMSVNLSPVVSKDEIPTSQRPIPNMCLIPSFFSFTSLVNFFPLCFYFHYLPFLQSHSSIFIIKTRQNQTSPLLPQFPSAIAVFIFSLPIHYSTHLSQLPSPSHLVTLIKYH